MVRMVRSLADRTFQLWHPPRAASTGDPDPEPAPEGAAVAEALAEVSSVRSPGRHADVHALALPEPPLPAAPRAPAWQYWIRVDRWDPKLKT